MKYLIVGLGNIGAEYVNTRHNVGFSVVDAMALKAGVEFASDRYGAVTEVRWRGRTLLLLKPSTYMNLSGKAVRYWLQKENIPTENLLVVVDDLALPIGAFRLRAQGSHGGHNGLRNIDEMLGTNRYARLRVGIGNDFPRGMQVDFVLSRFTTEEREALVPVAEELINLIRMFTTEGVNRTMNTYNKKGIGAAPAEDKKPAEQPATEKKENN
ncbi:MAG: aminoacyl-tRNA hydrolase [Tidjanibacter sp.]|nr:aminoacyl-tRNA hydrolase [Tidjanibacter sp.]